MCNQQEPAGIYKHSADDIFLISPRFSKLLPNGCVTVLKSLSFPFHQKKKDKSDFEQIYRLLLGVSRVSFPGISSVSPGFG